MKTILDFPKGCEAVRAMGAMDTRCTPEEVGLAILEADLNTTSCTDRIMLVAECLDASTNVFVDAIDIAPHCGTCSIDREFCKFGAFIGKMSD